VRTIKWLELFTSMFSRMQKVMAMQLRWMINRDRKPLFTVAGTYSSDVSNDISHVHT
jgi:hypothetical protein